ncbi:4-hydroxy-tetrahydrodipicolinate synthase-like [Stegodyphus dumicola]|uniref:4-hydroxy-tetrahydrodipicolinate synthase-like n=1 Tax=Stegodyphus dumicola TaxID=202533 RepID=UPI0015B18ADE|nr:4-hydroxy-tetrahydrodipicolinate synthase-like [Stegodyphus dumicola]
MGLSVMLREVSDCTCKFITLLEVQGKRAVIEWCMKVGLIATFFVCSKCGENMRFCERKGSIDGFEWRCRKQGKVNAHDVCRSIRKGSWFSHSHLSICDILRITRCWFLKMGNESVIQEVKVHEHAVVDWFMFCREVCMTTVINDDSVPIGAEGVIVEVMEVGIKCSATLRTIELTNKMADNGANAALVISPFFYKGRMNDDALYDHYIKVADGSKIPIILYSVPANTNLDLSSSLVAKLAEHPNIIGMKDSGGDITKIAHIVHKTKTKDFQVLAGSASFLYPALCVGCVGGVVALANPLSKQVCELYQYAMDGKHDEACNLQHRLIGPNLCVSNSISTHVYLYWNNIFIARHGMQ